MTLHQLSNHPIQLHLPRIFACENPAVLRRACEELGPACPPLVCTEGQPSTAFRRLVALALAGGELWYHGDFDWPGVAIAADLIARHGAVPWRLTAQDYLSGAGLSGAGFGAAAAMGGGVSPAAAAAAGGGVLPAAEAEAMAGVGVGVALSGDPVATPWDPALREAMCATQRAIYEETVTDSLISDLANYAATSR